MINGKRVESRESRESEESGKRMKSGKNRKWSEREWESKGE